ncbi:hypothetical protein GJ496_004906 [Pomphorhynchus laevis]|nr:hypothetical protein GJ496_004906 [Pomphorhynchus laevis]
MVDTVVQNTLDRYGIRLLKPEDIPKDDIISVIKLKDGTYVISPSTDSVCILENIFKFKRLIILDQFMYNELLVAHNDNHQLEIIFLPVMYWFLNKSEKEYRHVKHELIKAPMIYRLYEELISDIPDLKSRKFLIDVEMLSLQILTRMVRSGICVDQHKLEYCSQVLSSLKIISSSDQCHSGKIKQSKRLVANLLLRNKMFAHYLDKWYLNCTLLYTPTKTGIYYLRNPLIQSTPNTFCVQNISINPRSIFTSSNERLLISVDYSQFGLRAFALLSNNNFLKSQLNDPDPFRTILKLIDDSIDISKNELKTLIHALTSGCSESLISKLLKISVDDASIFKSRFLNLCKINEDGFQVGQETFFGKRDVRYLDTSSRIQSSASEIVKLGIISVWHQIQDITLVYYNNDEVMYECEKDSHNANLIFGDEHLKHIISQMSNMGTMKEDDEFTESAKPTTPLVQSEKVKVERQLGQISETSKIEKEMSGEYHGALNALSNHRATINSVKIQDSSKTPKLNVRIKKDDIVLVRKLTCLSEAQAEKILKNALGSVRDALINFVCD